MEISLSTGNEDKQIWGSFSHIQSTWFFHIAHGFAKITENWSTPVYYSPSKLQMLLLQRACGPPVKSQVSFPSSAFPLTFIWSKPMHYGCQLDSSTQLHLSSFQSKFYNQITLKLFETPWNAQAILWVTICNQQITHVQR